MLCVPLVESHISMGNQDEEARVNVDKRNELICTERHGQADSAASLVRLAHNDRERISYPEKAGICSVFLRPLSTCSLELF